MKPKGEPQRLAGRRVIVTGAASGIGLATAHRLSAEGARVAIADVRADGVDAATELVGGEAIGVVVDVGDEESVERAVATAAAAFGGIDTLVACAGIVRVSATHLTDLAEWETTIRVNLTGTFLPIKHALPHLIESGDGVIATVGSVASVVAAGRASSYDASKGGVLQLTRAVAVEYAEAGVRANCILPGLVRTGLAANSKSLHGALGDNPARPGLDRLNVPIARAADPDEIASVIAFAVSPDASFMTGSALTVDGGYTAI